MSGHEKIPQGLDNSEGYDNVTSMVTMIREGPCKKQWTFKDWNKFHQVLVSQSNCFVKFQDSLLRFFLVPHSKDMRDQHYYITINFYSLWVELMNGRIGQAFHVVSRVPKRPRHDNSPFDFIERKSSFVFTATKTQLLVEQNFIFMGSEYIDISRSIQYDATDPCSMHPCQTDTKDMVIQMEVSRGDISTET